MITMKQEFVLYHVTGVDCSGKRFKIVTNNALHARGINVWRGTKWGVRKDGTRKKLVVIYN
jgi:hypothetical protein